MKKDLIATLTAQIRDRISIHLRKAALPETHGEDALRLSIQIDGLYEAIEVLEAEIIRN